jgi:hypothetical protein
MSPVLAVCVAYVIMLNLVTLIEVCEEYKV